MTAASRADLAPARATKGRPAPRRASLVDAFLEIRPAVVSRLQAAVPEELRTELGVVTAHQLQAISQLPADGLTMHELASALKVSGPAACTLADRLVGRGLAGRMPDPADRRVVRLVPTSEGRALAKRYEEAQRLTLAAMLEKLSDDQLAAFVDIMESLAAADAGAPR